MDIVEASSPSLVMAQPVFKADKITGVIIMVVAALSALAGACQIWLGAMLGPVFQAFNSAAMASPAKGEPYVVQNGHVQSLPTFQFATTLSALGWIFVGIAVLQLVSGIGVFKGIRKGLVLALVVAALSVLEGVLGIIFGLWVAVYVIRRLWRNVGPRPA